MSIFKTRAIVLKSQDYKENDKILWLFSEKLGKISCIARGAKRKRSKLASFTQQFCYGEYIIYKGKSLYTINEIELIDSFQTFLNDLDSITYASYLCELIMIALTEQESNRALFQDFVKAFYLIKSEAIDFEMIARAFEIKILKHTGYGMNFNSCCICNNRMSSTNKFSLKYYGGICKNCNDMNYVNISNGAFNLLRFLNRTEIENVHRVTLSKELKKEIYSLLNALICQSYSKRPKSLDIFKYLKEE
ncbi:DNA repair protein RecO [Clostridium sediminicola]|uniref:DNA repair protein RecO n=1 Tax=Clostridium sediminicola TaxID=3114879 RepID=UPI0031F21FF0